MVVIQVLNYKTLLLVHCQQYLLDSRVTVAEISRYRRPEMGKIQNRPTDQVRSTPYEKRQ